MKVVFAVGDLSTSIIDKHLKNLVDNVEFYACDSVDGLISLSQNRGFCFDRIVFSRKFLKNIKEDLEKLAEYLFNDPSSKNKTKVVYFGYGDDMVKGLFDELFNNSLLHVSVISEGSTADLFKSLIKDDVETLRNRGVANTQPVIPEQPKQIKEKKGFGKFGFQKQVQPVVDAVGDLEGLDEGFPDTTFSDGLLGLGEFDLDLSKQGEDHIDTGYLSESDLSRDLEEFTIDDTTPEIDIFEEVEEVEEVLTMDQKSVSSRSIRIITGSRGSGVTSKIIDESFLTARGGENGTKGKKRVLVIDLDQTNNGVLSFIDTFKFYKRACNGGITDQSTTKIYREDGVDIISNGFGQRIDKDDVVRLLESELVECYDVIYIDCPLDCIGLLSVDLIKSSICMIRVVGHRGSLHSTLNQLTSRKFTTPELEDALYEHSKFLITDKIPEYAEDLKYLRDSCLFSRGDWFSKIRQ